MAATPPPVAAASRGAGGDVSIRMPAAAAATAAAAGGVVPQPQPREGNGGADANANPEKQLSRFVRCVALGEWAGNAFGALAFLWATVVLLGGFCSSLNRQDFWFAAVMIFIESFRIFIHRNNKIDGQSLFGTTTALRWNSSFLRMLVRPQEGNEAVLALCLWLNLIDAFGFVIIRKETGLVLQVILGTAVFVTWRWRPRRPKQWQVRALAIGYLLSVARYYIVQGLFHVKVSSSDIIPDIIILLTVMMPNLRPLWIAKLTSTPCGRKLISIAKLATAFCLASAVLIFLAEPLTFFYITVKYSLNFAQSLALLVLSLSSLQNHEGSSLFGRCTDAIMHISFIFYFVVLFPAFEAYIAVPGLSTLSCAVLSLVLLLVLLLSGNLQIPAAVAQIVLSSLRLIDLLVAHIDYNPLPSGTSHNMVPAIAAFYVLALCQGSLYIIASFVGLLSCFPRRWLMQRAKLGGKLGAKAIDQYYDRAYAKQMEMGMFGAAGRRMTFADFATESLSSSSSSSREQKVAGLCVLHNMLKQRRDDCSKQRLVLRVTSSSTMVSTLVGMLAWTDVEDEHSCRIIRLLAARVTAELAGSLRISSVPGMLKTVSWLLTHAVVRQEVPLPTSQQAPSIGGCSSWVVCRRWQRIKEKYWSAPPGDPDLSSTHQDSSLPVLGMKILEELAGDLDNCAEILKDETNLISKTIGIIGYASASDSKQNDDLVCSSLKFLRRLATTGERIGVKLRHELWSHTFLLTNLARALELKDDPSSSSSSSNNSNSNNNSNSSSSSSSNNSNSSSSSSRRRPRQIWEPAMDIIAKLALDSAAGPEIGKNQVITERLMDVFLGQHGPNNDTYYDWSLRRVSGEALANLALWGTANCSAILKAEPGYQVINGLKNMLRIEEHRYVAASLLLNLCVHCSVDLLQSHPQASEDLPSALTIVMERIIIMVAEDKELECLINLASEILLKKDLSSEIGDVIRKAFDQSQSNIGAKLVQKIVSTIDSRKVPSHEYPRMRRVIVKIIISILEWCDHTEHELMEKQLLDAVTKIDRTPSKVEEYRVFYGNIGVVREDDGESMSTLVARAKALLIQRTTQTGEAQRDNNS